MNHLAKAITLVFQDEIEEFEFKLHASDKHSVLMYNSSCILHFGDHYRDGFSAEYWENRNGKFYSYNLPLFFLSRKNKPLGDGSHPPKDDKYGALCFVLRMVRKEILDYPKRILNGDQAWKADYRRDPSFMGEWHSEIIKQIVYDFDKLLFSEFKSEIQKYGFKVHALNQDSVLMYVPSTIILFSKNDENSLSVEYLENRKGNYYSYSLKQLLPALQCNCQGGCVETERDTKKLARRIESLRNDLVAVTSALYDSKNIFNGGREWVKEFLHSSSFIGRRNSDEIHSVIAPKRESKISSWLGYIGSLRYDFRRSPNHVSKVKR